MPFKYLCQTAFGEMEHQHNHSSPENVGISFKTGIALNIAFVFLEVVVGLFSNSMALVSDAGHNFSDVVALAFSWIAIRISERKPTLKFTYGFRRSTILAAILNTLLLLIANFFLLWETIHRLKKPVEVDSSNVIIVALVGIAINGFTAWLFTKGKKHDLNIRSAFVHFIADTLVSAGVVIAGVIIYFTGAAIVDSIVSFIIIIVIFYSAYRLLIDSITLALDAVPENIDINAVRGYLGTIPEVLGIHDLHIWALGTNSSALTAHLETNIQTDSSFISRIQTELKARFNIDHSTIQIEFGSRPEPCNECN